MKKLMLLFLSLMICVTSSAQIPDTLWTKTFGGTGDETPSCIQISNDNGFILLGTTLSFGNGQQDIYLIKTDSSGNVEWSRTYGGTSLDEGSYILTTNDGGYLMMCNTWSISPGGTWLLRLDSSGDTLWTKHFGNMNWDNGMYMTETSDGGYAFIGQNYSNSGQYSDLWIIKTDSSGNKMWEKIYGGVSYDFGSSILQTPDQGFLALGTSQISDSSRIWLIKTNSEGDSLWSKKFGAGSGESLLECHDGNYLITASTYMLLGSRILKIDPDGNTLWSKSFETSLQHGNTIVQCPDNGFIIAGYTSMIIYGQSDLTVTKIDEDGDAVWVKMLGGSGQEIGKSICRTTNSEYIILGSEAIWGYSDTDLWLILLDKEVPSGIDNYYDSQNSSSLLQNFPNPFNSSSSIIYSIPKSSQVTLKIFNALGEEIETLVNEEKPVGTYEVTWNALNMPSGVYFYRIQAGNFIQTKKMILLK